MVFSLYECICDLAISIPSQFLFYESYRLIIKDHTILLHHLLRSLFNLGPWRKPCSPQLPFPSLCLCQHHRPDQAKTSHLRCSRPHLLLDWSPPQPILVLVLLHLLLEVGSHQVQCFILNFWRRLDQCSPSYFGLDKVHHLLTGQRILYAWMVHPSYAQRQLHHAPSYATLASTGPCITCTFEF